jgi:hypothetical protein
MPSTPAQGTVMTTACTICGQTGRVWGTFDTGTGQYACDRCVAGLSNVGTAQVPSAVDVTGYVSGDPATEAPALLP